MPNRGFDTRGKESRRLRLWLKPATWRLLEAKEAERAWPSDDNSIVERVLEDWASRAQLAQLSEPQTGSRVLVTLDAADWDALAAEAKKRNTTAAMLISALLGAWAYTVVERRMGQEVDQ